MRRLIPIIQRLQGGFGGGVGFRFDKQIKKSNYADLADLFCPM